MESTNHAPPPPPLVHRRTGCLSLNISLRFLLFVAMLIVIILLLTADYNHGYGLSSKLKHDIVLAKNFSWIVPSTVCYYGILSGILFFCEVRKPITYFKLFEVYHTLTIFDTIMLSLLAAHIGPVGGSVHMGKNGWRNKNYPKYYKHILTAEALSLFAFILLVIIIRSSVVSLHRLVFPN